MEIIKATGLSHSYDGAAHTLSNVDFTLNEREVVYVTGPSGCGKSTFLKILNRLVEPQAGKMFFKGLAYDALDVKKLRKKIQLVQQTPVLFDNSVRENLLLATPDASEQRISHLLAEFNLPPDIMDKNAKKLSVGQAQRVCMVRSLLLEPEALLLDEPTAPLDPKNRDIFQKTFEHVRGELGLATVWVTHDAERASKSGCRRLNLEKGRMDDR
jgi:putative ABC transport system ATP-binding protein